MFPLITGLETYEQISLQLSIDAGSAKSVLQPACPIESVSYKLIKIYPDQLCLWFGFCTFAVGKERLIAIGALCKAGIYPIILRPSKDLRVPSVRIFRKVQVPIVPKPISVAIFGRVGIRIIKILDRMCTQGLKRHYRGFVKFVLTVKTCNEISVLGKDVCRSKQPDAVIRPKIAFHSQHANKCVLIYKLIQWAI